MYYSWDGVCKCWMHFALMIAYGIASAVGLVAETASVVSFERMLLADMSLHVSLCILPGELLLTVVARDKRVCLLC